MSSDSTPAPPPAPIAKPDAVLFPRGWVTGRSEFKTDALDQLEPILGRPVFVRDLGPHLYLATRAAADTRFFPHAHPLAGRSRYAWTDAPGPGGAKFGTLVPEALNP